MTYTRRPTDEYLSYMVHKQSFVDPQSLEASLGISKRQIVNACKRNGWPWRKVYGRIWVCADFKQRWTENRAADIDT